MMHILLKIPRLLVPTSRFGACVSRSFYIYSPEPLHALLDKEPTWKTADQAVEAIKSGNIVAPTLSYTYNIANDLI